MKKLCKGIFIGIFAFLFFQTTFAQTNLAALGEQLEKNLFQAVSTQNWSALDAMIAPGFQSVNSDKIRNRADGIEYIKSLRFKNYTFHNLKVTQNPSGNILVVTYEMNYAETVQKRAQAGELTKNLSVWERVDGKWMWIAHAVLD